MYRIRTKMELFIMVDCILLKSNLCNSSAFVFTSRLISIVHIYSPTHFNASLLQMGLTLTSCCCTTQLFWALPMAALHSQGLWGLGPPMTSLDQGLQGSAHCHQRATWVFQDCGCTGLMAAPLCQEVGVVIEGTVFIFGCVPPFCL